MKILEFIFSSFWIWLGFIIIFGGLLNFIFNFYCRTLRFFNIKKHGYPKNCNADGDCVCLYKDNE